jgi:hypothetical protein
VFVIFWFWQRVFNKIVNDGVEISNKNLAKTLTFVFLKKAWMGFFDNTVFRNE